MLFQTLIARKVLILRRVSCKVRRIKELVRCSTFTALHSMFEGVMVVPLHFGPKKTRHSAGFLFNSLDPLYRIDQNYYARFICMDMYYLGWMGG